MKKLLSILAAVGLSATSGSIVVACAPKDKVDEGDFGIQLAKGTKITPLGATGELEILNYAELKETLENFKVIPPVIGVGAGVISEETTFNAETGIFTIKGLKLGTAEIQVQAEEKSSETLAVVKKISNKIKVDVVASDDQLKDLVPVTELTKEGEVLKDNKTATIIEKVLDLNPGAEGKVAVNGDSVKETETKGRWEAILVPATEGQFVGEVKVFFNLTVLPELKTIVTQTDLGTLTNNDKLTIRDKVKEVNKLDDEIIAVQEGSVKETETPNHWQATIIPFEAGKNYQGEVIVYFDFTKPSE